jgi:hypothetical protein
VEDGTPDDILWDDSEQNGEDALFSENESGTEGLLYILSE